MTDIITKPYDPRISYTGRIERENGGVTLCWCGSRAELRFFGTKLAIKGYNDNFGPETYIGAVIDGKEYSYKIGGTGEISLVLAENLDEKLHLSISAWRGTSLR